MEPKADPSVQFNKGEEVDVEIGGIWYGPYTIRNIEGVEATMTNDLHVWPANTRLRRHCGLKSPIPGYPV